MASKLEVTNVSLAEITVLEGAKEYYLTADEDRRVLWKIDRVVMPTMMVVLFFQCKTVYKPASAVLLQTGNGGSRS